ncbi:hypothetical protein BU15DRAFT_72392 [Melanogaster broomeanus]|nr:hypothetical protein BU15DRAFT_72392 [Melanogaster broomeanus]
MTYPSLAMPAYFAFEGLLSASEVSRNSNPRRRTRQDEIAQVTEEVISARMTSREWNHFETLYYPGRKRVPREIMLETVKYAMFSHRWDAAGEPTYRDTAKSLGYKLAWSDTCCINKSNGAELSEAFRAMFKWYSHSDLCIIHLAESSSCSDFDHEPWFTRGWTLQELLAPRRVKFYTKTWEPLTTHATH